MLVWPDRRRVDEAVRCWAEAERSRHPTLLRVGYFGSYARGGWGVGSDIDLVILVSAAERPFHERALDWDATSLPVPADLVVYTMAEWNAMQGAERGFARRLRDETVWVLDVDRARAAGPDPRRERG